MFFEPVRYRLFQSKGKRVFLPFVKQLKESCFAHQNISSSIVDFV
ncbi:hypothetical protein EH11_04213 [Bacillus subtilis]|nr:hypothetical protein EH11_04213 [Bacillus subtilis]